LSAALEKVGPLCRQAGVQVILVGAPGGGHDAPTVAPAAARDSTPAAPVTMVVEDTDGLLEKRYDARQGTCYLIRPDQHIAARWRGIDPGRIQAALRRATGHSLQGEPA
jgi:3-(3-hydroxy-phenyl)propionate hydroxylase